MFWIPKSQVFKIFEWGHVPSTEPEHNTNEYSKLPINNLIAICEYYERLTVFCCRYSNSCVFSWCIKSIVWACSNCCCRFSSSSCNSSFSKQWYDVCFLRRNFRTSRSKYSFCTRWSLCSSWASNCFRFSFWLLEIKTMFRFLPRVFDLNMNVFTYWYEQFSLFYCSLMLNLIL